MLSFISVSPLIIRESRLENDIPLQDCDYVLWSRPDFVPAALSAIRRGVRTATRTDVCDCGYK